MTSIAATHWLNIDWDNPEAETVDGFTVGEIDAFVYDSVVDAVCSSCEATHRVEPDARDYTGHSCGEEGVVTSPLVKLGLV